MGSLAPSGGLKVTDIAVATIEKANSLINRSAILIEGFMGSLAPSGGLKVTDIAVATIEKANSLINR